MIWLVLALFISGAVIFQIAQKKAFDQKHYYGKEYRGKWMRRAERGSLLILAALFLIFCNGIYHLF